MVDKSDKEAPASAASPLFQAATPAPDDTAAPAKKATRRRATRKTAPPEPADSGDARDDAAPEKSAKNVKSAKSTKSTKSAKSTKSTKSAKSTKSTKSAKNDAATDDTTDTSSDAADDSTSEATNEDESSPRKRRRGGRGRRRKASDGDDNSDTNDVQSSDSNDESNDRSADGDAPDGEPSESDESNGDADGDADGSAPKRRRRRRRRAGALSDDEPSPDDPPDTVVKVRAPRERKSDRGDSDDMRGSTRLEAKKQRRREGREAGRRRAPILSEAEFLARRESVERVMVVRQGDDRTQIAVLEDGVLVEHYVTKGSSTSMVGNVYLGRVQNVLPSMEAAFVDIGRGRNAVLYAGEVNWDAAGLDGQPKRIEFALKSGDPVLVQVTKDPVGQKGARLTSQISLPGRFLVYVPDGSMTGISRKLPDTERGRLKSILKRVMPEDAGVIVRTAAEGASEDALEADVERLQALWTDITDATTKASPPELLYSEPDIAIKVVRDMFNEDVAKLVISGDSAWRTVDAYISAVAPDLLERLDHWVQPEDVFAHYRIDEQLMKALDRKVWLPSGGSLVIDRTEAMTVVDVNTGKFTGSGGNLEQTVTKNNLEAAEEIVRQLRLRDIGGIIVVDFIDMVLESNRDLVLRRLVECLGRDRTKHQVAEVTSLGLVQMTRKRIGSGLLESFSETCEVCNGRGVKVSLVHAHEPAPRSRRPAGAVDPAEVAARALAAREAGTSTDAAPAVAAGEPEIEVSEGELPEADLPELPEAASDQSLFASDD